MQTQSVSGENEHVGVSFPESDIRLLRAAEGWLELGDHLSANEELENISPKLRAHPAVLSLRWEIYRRAKRWEMCFEISRTLTELEANNVRSWILHANTLYFAGRMQEAYDLAKAKTAEFPDVWVLWYDLGCYACKLRRMDDAKDCLSRAIKLGPPKDVKLRALKDPDYEPLWQNC